MDTIIHFYDMYGKETGTVTVRANGEMVGSDESKQEFADSWRNNGGSPQDFVKEFSDWGNGYASAKAE